MGDCSRCFASGVIPGTAVLLMRLYGPQSHPLLFVYSFLTYRDIDGGFTETKNNQVTLRSYLTQIIFYLEEDWGPLW